MLSSEELSQLVGAVCATAETLGQTISASAAEMIAEDLTHYTVAEIAGALKACRRELTGKLTLAAILQRIQAADGRPDPNEAWGIALASSDESDSVVTTEEIQLALGAARPILSAKDKVGARMAFISAYARFVDTARREAKPVKWSLSMGFDPQRRLVAVQEGVRMGRISQEAANEYGLQLTHEPITNDGLAIAGLLTGSPVAPPSEHLREKWQAVRKAITETTEARRKQESMQAARERKKLRVARAKAERAAINADQSGKEASNA
ncbi:conserved protein of unknown function [Pseudomonas marincola]|uniref:Uncharacterized protein n=1 Tax=Pseudomonas marincola TaxID=437900 RepID=A0A653E629_9PSED|nr:hypothetical protein [Pseudomonas marincola]CAE6906306.1 conserved protein of unknown function [Pseudomonas marincola]